jgi:hypothetical protein
VQNGPLNTGSRLSRLEGVLLLLGYGVYVRREHPEFPKKSRHLTEPELIETGVVGILTGWSGG